MSYAIKVSNLSKQYTIGEYQGRYKSLRDSLSQAALAPLRRLGAGRNGRKPENTIWALKDVSFEVRHGEVVGIIGRNGAGKSTLLKILARITEPTGGEVRVRGRVGSLLEVGTGFHPELTGRENIFLNGAILGMSRREIQRKFDEIVDFAEIEKFIDTPAKHYSSGMYMRLAFAVAAHLDPEVLLVDEVLAVGDAEFQKKCLGKIDKVAKEGRTVVFVSHNIGALKKLCSKGIFLENGVNKYEGSLLTAINFYQNHQRFSQHAARWERGPSTKSATLLEVGVLNDGKCIGTEFSTELPTQIYIKFRVNKCKAKIGTSILLYTAANELLLVSMSNHEPEWHMKERPKGVYQSVCEIPANLLADGVYSVSVALWEGFYESGIVENDILKFSMHEKGLVRGDYPSQQHGHIIQPLLKWVSTKLPEES